MPYEKEHSCRLKNPDQYDRFARKNCEQKHDGKCIDVIYGVKEGKSEIQALRYNKKIWTEEAARNHCKSHEGTFEAAQETKEGNMENKEYKITGDKIEWRVLPLESLEVRAEDGKPAIIAGVAAPFEKLSEIIMGSFREKISPDAFNETLEDDIRCLFNHDPNYVLGRTAAGTLRLSTDKSGLRFENDPPDTQWAKDLQVSIRRGDVNQMSFAFECIKDSWDKSGKIPIRTLEKVKLQDIAIVTYPAYPQTKVGLRAVTEDELRHVLNEYFPPKTEQVPHTPQELTEGHLEIPNRRQAFLKLIK